jgi:amidase
MADESWRALCVSKLQRQQDAIPKDWLVSPLPTTDRLNVLDFPRDSGLLNGVELEITDSDVETLLLRLASGAWSSVQVTRAFYRRAILAHQVVCCHSGAPNVHALIMSLGELFNGNLC